MSDYEEVLNSVVSDESSGGAAGYGSGLIGGILDAVIGPVMSNVQFQRQKHVSNRQMRAAEFIAENQPSWAVEGLRRAGLNPALAYMKGISPVSFAPSNRPDVARSGGISAALARGVSSAKQMTLLSDQASLLKNEARKVANEANASEELRNRMRAEIGEIDARSRLADAETRAVASRIPVSEAEEPLRRAQEAETQAREAAERMKVYVERLGIPWSDEQKDWVRKTPVGEMSRAIKRGARGIYEMVRDVFTEDK